MGQDIVGILLYHYRDVDPTLAAALSTIASKQANSTQETAEACHQLLDFVMTNPDAIVHFLSSEMILTIHLDSSYLSESKAGNRAAGHFYLANKNNEEFNNASEAELAALFYNAREAVTLRVTLEEMGHPQAPTPLITDNNTAHGLITKAMIPKCSKVVNMRFHCLKCREAQTQFNIKWKQGTVNKADYLSRHRPPAVHQQRCSQYVVNAAVTTENKILAQQIKNVA
eukprot:1363656-Ditylum_brightwellii.AAC.1